MSGKITKSEILKRWNNASSYSWEESSTMCGVCNEAFSTGDVIFVFGDLEHAVSRRAYVCVRCGIVAIAEEGGLKPSAAMVFVQASHRNLLYDTLSGKVQERLIQGFRILDDLAAGVTKAARGSQS